MYLGGCGQERASLVQPTGEADPRLNPQGQRQSNDGSGSKALGKAQARVIQLTGTRYEKRDYCTVLLGWTAHFLGAFYRHNFC